MRENELQINISEDTPENSEKDENNNLIGELIIRVDSYNIFI